MKYRLYNPEKDREAAHRIWLETGWIEKDNPKPMDIMIESARTIVVDVNGQPECLVLSFPGNIDYSGEKLPFSGIGGVTTSLIARKQGIAGRLSATRIALDVMDGASVCGLGMFEQGYYDKLGFGTGGYEHIVRFAPSTLNLDITPRIPDRITEDDWKQAHESRLKRLRVHGSINFNPEEITRAEMKWSKSGFGYGYHNEEGELTHHIWMTGKGKEHGPFRTSWMVFRNYEQFLELMALIKSFGEQVHLVSMIEPPNVQMQDLLNMPFHYHTITAKSEFENIIKAAACWQMRICNLEKCLECTHLQTDDMRFNLILNDPIENYLDDDAEWRGLSGNYIITLGKSSGVEEGSDDDLPVVKASVGAFTRMWLGVLPASSLTVSDDLSAPEPLLKRLDELFRLPKPSPDWDF